MLSRLTRRKVLPKVRNYLQIELLELTNVCSRGAVQGCRQCPDNEAEPLQGHGVEQVSNCYSVLEEGAWMESRKSFGASCVLFHEYFA